MNHHPLVRTLGVLILLFALHGFQPTLGRATESSYELSAEAAAFEPSP